MGGVAGHAGLFTTVADLARFARMLLNGGVLDGRSILRPETVQKMTSVQTPPMLEARRGLGWDIASPYSRPRGRLFPMGSYGHTGFTGTSLWVDPLSRTFWIFLSNRVHPDGKGNILLLQSELGTLAAQSIVGFDFEGAKDTLLAGTASGLTNPVAAPTVLNGIDVLVRDGFKILQGMKVGLISNQTGHDRRRRTTIDLLFKAPGVKLMALFSPEHGIRGEADEKVADGHDSRTGLPIYSLYGERRSPIAEQLNGLDVLVFDIQDIGTRYYTYLATLGNCMEAAAKSGIRFVVLDRVNPINGLTLEGPVHTNTSTFVAYHRIPVRHGMTVGELARMFRQERGWTLDLTVVPVEGWKRQLWFDETGLPWTHP
ncbi:MAG: exo-beta-N-acetylmuramidase NamZ domain-containing protein, partial [Verrucomicrobiales bacterium]